MTTSEKIIDEHFVTSNPSGVAPVFAINKNNWEHITADENSYVKSPVASLPITDDQADTDFSHWYLSDQKYLFEIKRKRLPETTLATILNDLYLYHTYYHGSFENKDKAYKRAGINLKAFEADIFYQAEMSLLADFSILLNQQEEIINNIFDGIQLAMRKVSNVRSDWNATGPEVHGFDILIAFVMNVGFNAAGSVLGNLAFNGIKKSFSKNTNSGYKVFSVTKSTQLLSRKLNDQSDKEFIGVIKDVTSNHFSDAFPTANSFANELFKQSGKKLQAYILKGIKENFSGQQSYMLNIFDEYLELFKSGMVSEINFFKEELIKIKTKRIINMTNSSYINWQHEFAQLYNSCPYPLQKIEHRDRSSRKDYIRNIKKVVSEEMEKTIWAMLANTHEIREPSYESIDGKLVPSTHAEQVKRTSLQPFEDRHQALYYLAALYKTNPLPVTKDGFLYFDYLNDKGISALINEMSKYNPFLKNTQITETTISDLFSEWTIPETPKEKIKKH